MDVTDRHLLTLPLHTVTEVYGTAGLRRRLALELRTVPGRALVADAAGWAAALHDGQRRTREPYVNHLYRVALRIRCHYRVDDAEVLAAALLHDAVEDQPWRVAGVPAAGAEPREAAFAALTVRYGTRVTRLVGAVTNPFEGDYVEHLADALGREPWARVLKLSDFTDNGVGIGYAVGAKVHRVARKYTPAVPVLRELLHRPDTPLPPAVKAHIDGQLDLAVERLAAALAA